MKSFIFALCVLFAACEDSRSDYPMDVEIGMSCMEANSQGLIPDVECVNDTTAIMEIEQADYNGERCVITLDMMSCDYCNEDGYSGCHVTEVE